MMLHILSCENLNTVIAENELSKVNIKNIWWDTAHVNRNGVKKRYDEGDPNLPMVGRECTCLLAVQLG